VSQGSFFETFDRQIEDTSLDAYRRIWPTLPQRERAVFLSLCDYCREHEDATGGELAAYMDWPVTSTRPRLTSLEQRGWIVKTPARSSRIPVEGRCHGYQPNVPRQAVARLRGL
jgi:hypothetical protein